MLPPLAGFQVTINGRFWVTAEVVLNVRGLGSRFVQHVTDFDEFVHSLKSLRATRVGHRYRAANQAPTVRVCQKAEGRGTLSQPASGTKDTLKRAGMGVQNPARFGYGGGTVSFDVISRVDWRQSPSYSDVSLVSGCYGLSGHRLS